MEIFKPIFKLILIETQDHFFTIVKMKIPLYTILLRIKYISRIVLLLTCGIISISL